MLIDREFFEDWMRRIMERFDLLEKRNPKAYTKERLTYNGELLYDNQDLCVLLNVGKRTLQRYRSLGWLPYRKIDQKSYYLESEVQKFIKEHFDKNSKKSDET